MNRIFSFLVLFGFGLFFSCAYTYKMVELPDYKTTNTNSDQLNFSVVVLDDSLNIWELAGNNKLAKNCIRKKLQFSVVEVTNFGDSIIQLSPNDIEVFSNLELTEVLLFKDYFKKIRQPSLLFLGYGLGTIGISNKGIMFAQEPISASILFLLAGYNITKSIISNHKIKKQVEQLDIFNQPILPHSSSKGIICTHCANPGKLFIRIKKP
jgi:hypothetical protein